MTEAERYIALANLKQLDPAKGQDHTDEMWHIIRGLAVLDWTLARRDPNEGQSEKAMQQYATLMRKVQQLALTVMEEQGIPTEATVVN